MPDRSATDRPGTEISWSTAEPLTRLVTRVARTVTARVQTVLRPEGLNLDQWLVIEALAQQRGLTMADLATRTMTTGPTLTRVVDRLVSTATAYREVDVHDRRRVRVYLSPRGRLAYRRIAAKVRDVEQELLARWAQVGL
jgi:DNA-binding MarR family transcriptional regulator